MSQDFKDYRIKITKERNVLFDKAMEKSPYKNKSDLIFHLLDIFVSKPNLFEDSMVSNDLQSILESK